MKKLLIGVVLALGFQSVYGQASLGIGGGGQLFNIDTTPCENSNDSYFYYIKNTGNAPIVSRWVYIHTIVDSTLTFSWLPAPMDSTFISLLPPGDSVAFFDSVYYDTTDLYRVGGNIVVIWPSSSGLITTDSSNQTYVDVQLCSGIPEIDQERSLTIFPNPSSENISIMPRGKNMEVVLIRLLDPLGNVLAEQRNKYLVSVKEYPEGVYFIQAEFTDGSLHTYKIIRKD